MTDAPLTPDEATRLSRERVDDFVRRTAERDRLRAVQREAEEQERRINLHRVYAEDRD